ncbi:hypothetical protein SAMN05444172_8831 [Burkholderia sp. GAS332]|nr:hypothetical protein SAMN05444172_8831 [Burkholderia sp. GAS332]
MPVPLITPLDAAAALDLAITLTPPSTLLDRDGTTHRWCGLASADGAVRAGIWQAEALSNTKLQPGSMEFCMILEGRVEITDHAGNVARSVYATRSSSSSASTAYGSH